MTSDEYLMELEENIKSIVPIFVYVSLDDDQSTFEYKKGFLTLMLKNALFEIKNLDEESRDSYEKLFELEGIIESEEAKPDIQANGNILHVNFGNSNKGV